MKPKLFTQLFFSVFVLAFGAWAFYEYKQSEKEQNQKIKETSFLTKKIGDLKAFRIKKRNQILEVVKKDQDWFLKKPVKDQASFTEISRWFDEIQYQKVQEIQKQKPINWKDYYLDKAPRVTMNFLPNETFSFSVSKKSSFDGKYFIKKGNSLFLAKSYFYSEVNEKDFSSFRRKKILPSLGHTNKIQFQGKLNLKLNWIYSKWSFDSSYKKNPFSLNKKRLNRFWTEANSLKALAIKEAISPSSLKKYGMDKAQLIIVLYYPYQSRKYTLKLSPFKKDKAYVTISKRNFILEISKEDAKKLILSKKDLTLIKSKKAGKSDESSKEKKK